MPPASRIARSPLNLMTLLVSSRSLRRIPYLSRLVNLTSLWLLAADDYGWLKELTDSKFEGIQKLMKLEYLYLGIATAKAVLQFDLGSLTCLKSLTLDFQHDLLESDASLLLPSAASSSLDIVSQGMHGLKFPNLSSLNNLPEGPELVFSNCLVKDGLDSLGIQHLDNVKLVIIQNSSVELIELTCLMKNLRALRIQDCGSFKTLPDLSKLKNLKTLYIKHCKEVVEITGLGSLVPLGKLSIAGCTSLERLENLSNLSDIILWNCPKLRTIEGIEGLPLLSLTICRCRSLQNRDELKKRCTKQAYIDMD